MCAEIYDHPSFLEKVKERIRQNRDKLWADQGASAYSYDVEDCRNGIGVFYSEERAVSSSRYIEMYLAQNEDIKELLTEARELMEWLTVLNRKYMESRTQVRRYYRKNKDLAAMLESRDLELAEIRAELLQLKSKKG